MRSHEYKESSDNLYNWYYLFKIENETLISSPIYCNIF